MLLITGQFGKFLGIFANIIAGFFVDMLNFAAFGI